MQNKWRKKMGDWLTLIHLEYSHKKEVSGLSVNLLNMRMKIAASGKLIDIE